MLDAGERLGAYTVVRKIGAGGMAEVYMARHRHIDRTVAIKVLRAEFSMQEESTARFFSEARAASSIKHPGIVEILDCDVLPDGRAYIVMEYLNGQNLRRLIADRESLGQQLALITDIVAQVATAVGAAHEKGIVHRDLKPDNIFLVQRDDGRLDRVKVLDFGIAKLLRSGSDDALHQTRTGSLLGTPLYMSPEQCRGISTIDQRADVYSLGCIAFEMFTGRPPFIREAPGDVLMAHMSAPAPSVATYEPSVPADLDQLITRMLAKLPDDRPARMQEVAARFGAVRVWASRQDLTAPLPMSGLGLSSPVPVPRPVLATTVPLPDSPPRGGAPVAHLAPTTTLSRSSAELIAPNPPHARRGLRTAAVALAIMSAGAVLFFSLSRPPDRTLRLTPVPATQPPAEPPPARETRPRDETKQPIEPSGAQPGSSFSNSGADLQGDPGSPAAATTKRDPVPDGPPRAAAAPEIAQKRKPPRTRRRGSDRAKARDREYRYIDE